jgi:mannosyl-oligosaccharide alpha-1,3-glucosidase
MVKHENFKTCDQSGFCKRNRQFADAAAADRSWESPYALDPSSIKFGSGQLTGVILKSIGGDEKVRLPVTISFLESGTARVTVDEEKRQKRDIILRHDSKARKERYNEAGNWAITGSLKGSKDAKVADSAETGTTVVNYGPNGAFQAVVKHSPFGVSFKRDGITQIQLNDRGLLNMEHWRVQPPVIPKEEPKEGETTEEKPEEKKDEVDTSNWWDESFGGSTDTKPKGPESIALDISFPGYDFVYGIPEHASSMALKQTRYVIIVASLCCI